MPAAQAVQGASLEEGAKIYPRREIAHVSLEGEWLSDKGSSDQYTYIAHRSLGGRILHSWAGDFMR
jgi:hypothetical protein